MTAVTYRVTPMRHSIIYIFHLQLIYIIYKHTCTVYTWMSKFIKVISLDIVSSHADKDTWDFTRVEINIKIVRHVKALNFGAAKIGDGNQTARVTQLDETK